MRQGVVNRAGHPLINDRAGALLGHGEFRVNGKIAKQLWFVPESDDSPPKRSGLARRRS
jgi:hypothetical protein